VKGLNDDRIGRKRQGEGFPENQVLFHTAGGMVSGKKHVQNAVKNFLIALAMIFFSARWH
jgi:hypothetical protein